MFKFHEIFTDEHLNRLAAAVRAANTPEWQKLHPDAKGWHAWAVAQKIIHPAWTESEIEQLLISLHDTLVGFTQADPNLAFYTPDDMQWLTERVQERDALALHIWLAKCALSPADEWLTPVQVAEMTHTTESGWRNKCAAGAIPGAIKRGKQWLLPKSILGYMGIL